MPKIRTSKFLIATSQKVALDVNTKMCGAVEILKK